MNWAGNSIPEQSPADTVLPSRLKVTKWFCQATTLPAPEEPEAEQPPEREWD